MHSNAKHNTQLQLAVVNFKVGFHFEALDAARNQQLIHCLVAFDFRELPG